MAEEDISAPIRTSHSPSRPVSGDSEEWQKTPAPAEFHREAKNAISQKEDVWSLHSP